MAAYGSADGTAARAFDALGSPTRRRILERVAVRPQPVGELAAALSVSQPAVSQHLRVLTEAGLVVGRPAGTRRIYQVERTGVAAMRRYLDLMWGDALAAFARAVEDDGNTTKDTRKGQQT